jgi:hypothetical protein
MVVLSTHSSEYFSKIWIFRAFRWPTFLAARQKSHISTEAPMSEDFRSTVFFMEGDRKHKY